MKAAAQRPLAGTTVVELAGLLPGPHAGALLAQLGAEVIKVERADGGDGTRALGERIFATYNRGKRSIAVDLKSEQGRRTIRTLFERADVVLEGFRPGVAERLDIGYPQARAINPKLVYCSISSFGQDGPYRDRTAHDLNCLSLAGYFAIPSQVDDRIARPKVRLADYAAAMHAALGVMQALMTVRLGGEGCHLDVAIQESISAWCLPHALAVRDGEAGDMEHAESVMPDNDLFRCADGLWLSLGIFENRYWGRLAELFGDRCAALREPALRQRAERMARKREVSELLAALFAGEPRDHWACALDATDIPWAPVYLDDQALDDPQLVHRRLTAPLEDHDSADAGMDLRLPMLINGQALWSPRPAPALGEHTEEILAELKL